MALRIWPDSYKAIGRFESFDQAIRALESWREVSPALDEAMQQLKAPDRDALVLRFFQNASLRAVGEGFGISEDAAQKRITRAKELPARPLR